jgi:diguanylate cyclase (GGDEF)-like protein
MKIENPELELLSNVARTLTEKVDPLEITSILGRVFTKYGRLSGKFLQMDKLNIYIYDENSRTLRNFSKSWIALEEKKQGTDVDKLYFALSQFTFYSFFLNNKGYKLDEIKDFSLIKGFNDENQILIPLKRRGKPFGILELHFPENVNNLMNLDFFKLLSVVTYQISLKIQNAILTEQMQKNVSFHESMKNIAKIIETQYELNYIIPIIGEMIDRFISDHLIYIFLKNEDGDFKLVWPNACRDQNILSVLSKVTERSRFILTEGEKTGIFPLVGEKALLGCVVAHSNVEKLSKKEIEYLEQLTTQSSMTIQRANVYAEVLKHATLDALTGLNNRHQFEVRLKQEVSSAKRQHKPLCSIMLDIDFFKKVNDTYGHAAGDCVLKTVAHKIKKGLRESDIPSRYGGEEFIILLPYTKMEEAYTVAERLRRSVEDSPVDFAEDENSEPVTIQVTISVGVYQFSETDAPDEVYQKADKALYKAKSSGRNRVIVYTPALASANNN